MSKIIPETYYGQPVDQDGLFETLKDRRRIIDHSDGTWYYGHDEMREGGCWAWMRSREIVDRSHNDIHKLEVKDGVWLLVQ